MIQLVRRLRCWLFGHAETVVAWGPWSQHPEYGRHRVIRTECSRCGAIFALRSEVRRTP